MQHFLIRQHYTFGWVLFGVVVGTYIWISAKPEPSAGPLAETGSAMASRAPKAVAFLAATSAMLMAPILGLLLESGDARAAAPIKVVFPVGNAGWSGPVAISDPDWRPEFLGADAVEQVAYHDDGGNSIEVAAIVYRHQEQGAELIGDSASLLGEGQWKAMSEEIVSSQAGKFRELMAADRQGRRLLIRYRYDIGGQQFVEPLLSQMWYGVRSLRGAPYSALVAYGAACSASCEEARNMIDTFLGQMARNVEASLPQRSR
jgi:EpsI family protein